MENKEIIKMVNREKELRETGEVIIKQGKNISLKQKEIKETKKQKTKYNILGNLYKNAKTRITKGTNNEYSMIKSGRGKEVKQSKIHPGKYMIKEI